MPNGKLQAKEVEGKTHFITIKARKMKTMTSNLTYICDTKVAKLDKCQKLLFFYPSLLSCLTPVSSTGHQVVSLGFRSSQLRKSIDEPIKSKAVFVKST